MCACSKGVSPKTTRHKGRKLEAVNVSDACEHWCDERLHGKMFRYATEKSGQGEEKKRGEERERGKESAHVKAARMQMNS